MAERIETDLEEEIIDFEEVETQRSAPRDIKINQNFDKYRSLLIGLGIGVLAIAVGAFAWAQFQESNNAEANDKAIFAFKYYEKDSLDKAVKGQAPYMGLKQIVDEYGSTKIGNTAKYMLGTALLTQGKTKEGQAQLDAFDKGDNMVSASAYAALAYANEEQNKFEDAANLYVKAAGIMENPITSSDYLMQAARCFEEAKNTEKALNAYKEIKQKYPMSEAGQNVDKYIARLSK